MAASPDKRDRYPAANSANRFKTLRTGYRDVEGKLYLYTERHPYESCNGVIEQFKEKFPNIEISAVFWDHPYPPVS
jgi:hypothetical protein